MTTSSLLPIFILVGIVVSLDVFGLTLSQGERLIRKRPSRFGWAAWNGAWHSCLFLLYAFVIAGAYEVRLELFSWLSFLPKLLLSFVSSVTPLELEKQVKIVASVLDAHAPIILGLITITIVWRTYAEKVVAKPEMGNADELPPIARVLYEIQSWLVRVLSPILRTRWINRKIPFRSIRRLGVRRNMREFIGWQASAALVAVDMLALAALMNAMGYMQSPENRWTLFIVVFVVVSLIAYAAGGVAIKIRQSAAHLSVDSRNWITITIRLLEPFMIFYFLLQLVGFLVFGVRVQSVGLVVGSIAMVWAIVSLKKMDAVSAASLSGFGTIQSSPELPDKPCFTDRVLRRILKTHDKSEPLHAILVLLARVLTWSSSIVIFLVIYSSLFGDASGDFSPEAATSAMLLCYTAAVALLQLAQADSEGESKDPLKSQIKVALESVNTCILLLLAISIAVLLPVADKFLEATPTMLSLVRGEFRSSDLAELGFRENHVHALQIAIWPMMMLALGLLYRVLGSSATRGRWANFAVFLLPLSLAGVAYVQEVLRKDVKPLVQSYQGTNGEIESARPPIDPSLAIDPRATAKWSQSLQGIKVLVLAGWIEPERSGGLHLLVDALLTNGATIEIYTGRDPALFKATLSSANALVVAEQFPHRKPTDAELGEFESFLEATSSRVRSWMSPLDANASEIEGGATRDTASSIEPRLLVCEADLSVGPGILAAKHWGKVEVLETAALSPKDQVNRRNRLPAEYAQIVPSPLFDGHSFVIQATEPSSIVTPMFFKEGIDDQRAVAEEIVAALIDERTLILGSDFHRGEHWTIELVVKFLARRP